MSHQEPWQIAKRLNDLSEQVSTSGGAMRAAAGTEGPEAESRRKEAIERCDQAVQGYESLLADLAGLKLSQKDLDEFKGNALYGIACARSIQERTAEALEAFRKALRGGFSNIGHAKQDEDLENIRKDPGFQEVLGEHHREKDALKEAQKRCKEIGGEGDGLLREGNELYQKAAGGEGAEADALRQEAAAKCDAACEKYAQKVSELRGLKLPHAVLAEERQTAYYNTACARALQGRKDEALDALDRALAAGFDIWIQVKRDPDFASIVNEPRFTELMKLAKMTKEIRDFYSDEIAKQQVLFPYGFQVKTLDGADLKLEDLRGKVGIISFWGTYYEFWDTPVKHLIQLQKAFDDRVGIVGMTWEDGKGGEEVEARLRGLVDELGIPYPLALVTNREELSRVPDFQGCPALLFLDKAGRVRFRMDGRSEPHALWTLARILDMEEA